ncbi:MAG: hypothetical protein K2X36_03245, partial [Microbacteriaceae bacterium]|nr:hypothetical protein [Microbacteriaceae bacterium]
MQKKIKENKCHNFVYDVLLFVCFFHLWLVFFIFESLLVSPNPQPTNMATMYHSFSLRQLESPDALFNSHSRCVNRLGTIILEAIALNFPKLDSTDVRRLPAHLKTLIIEYLVARDCLTENHLLLLLDEYQATLNFSNCSRITDKALALVSERCPRLRSFEVANCPLVTSKGLEALYSRYSVTGTLDLSKTKGVLTMKTARTMGKNCRALTSLVLDECHGVKDKAVEELLRATGGFLERASFKKSACTDAWLGVVANHCPQLKHLNVKSCRLVSSIGIGHIIFQCRGLASLNISGLKDVPTHDLKVLAHGLPRGLLKLNLSFTPGVTDEVVQTVASKCPQLERLDLRGIFGLKGGFLRDLLTRVPSLHQLRLDLCKDIEDEMVSSLYQPRRTPHRQPFVLSLKLRNLSLSGVKNLTDASIRALARSCPDLRAINL